MTTFKRTCISLVLLSFFVFGNCATQHWTVLEKTLSGAKKLTNGEGLSGDAKDAKTKSLDRKKNRRTGPKSFDSRATLDAMTKAKSGSNAFSQSEGAVIIGYFVGFQTETGESCNGHSNNPADWDYHCYIASTAHPKANDRIIFEVTPRDRFWSEDRLKALLGKRIRISGWLLDDWKHKKDSKADKPANRKDWRASCWEIHPVTEIEVAD